MQNGQEQAVCQLAKRRPLPEARIRGVTYEGNFICGSSLSEYGKQQKFLKKSVNYWLICCSPVFLAFPRLPLSNLVLYEALKPFVKQFLPFS